MVYTMPRSPSPSGGSVRVKVAPPYVTSALGLRSADARSTAWKKAIACSSSSGASTLSGLGESAFIDYLEGSQSRSEAVLVV